MNRAIPLLHLWACVACSRVNFTFYLCYVFQYYHAVPDLQPGPWKLFRYKSIVFLDLLSCWQGTIYLHAEGKNSERTKFVLTSTVTTFITHEIRAFKSVVTPFCQYLYHSFHFAMGKQPNSICYRSSKSTSGIRLPSQLSNGIQQRSY